MGPVEQSSTIFKTDPMSSKGPSRFSGPTSPAALWNYSKASIASLMGKLYESRCLGSFSRSNNSFATASSRLHSAYPKVHLCTDEARSAADRAKGPPRGSEPTSPPTLRNYSEASIASLMEKLYELLLL